MKLKHLKLLSPFRSLPAGFEIEFPENQSDTIDPYCLVGLNGSGKSNLLEVCSEVFYYLERYWEESKNIKEIVHPPFGFEITFHPSVLGKVLPFQGPIKITKNPNQAPFYQDLGKDANSELREFEAVTLPERIIGYSSGMNELLSNPFIKMDFHYFDEFQARVKDTRFDAIEVSRMFYMDYESNQLVTIANLLLPNLEDRTHLAVLTEELKIKDLHSFSITIRKRKYGGDAVEFPSELNQAIVFLEYCATCHQSYQEGKIEVIQLDYWVNDATKQAFRKHFRTAFELFRYLYLLRLLNLHAFREKLREEVKEAGQGVNLSALIPKPEARDLVFSINELSFRKQGILEPVYYKNLSDGEHQLLHVLGALILFDTPGTLFLLDEPETHFNPEWRSKFVSLMNKTITEKRQQEFILTTHSPFIISDCKPERVFIFERDENNQVNYRQPDFNTFGASVNLITLKVFGKRETIAEVAMERLRILREQVQNGQISPEEAQIAIFTEIGDSVEKMLAIDSINKLPKPN
ncbi:restriction system-associated AAA family ATPase [Runella defluvii]|uniref:Restriction system-associated AAA family ATPase n=1 Tax=Runella defluvii TaxID=370973 RepID=A0A7W5ZJB7_9BACT|nr:restriction system-associated AAA family ATPase [Runella defluvii]MBB3838176.1 restriction system-associated AAA family ATPase [Runella defluvii]